MLIVDDHTLFRSGMVHLLQSFDPPPEVLEAKDLRGAEALLKSDSNIDLVLLDLKLTDSIGIESLLALRKEVPDTALVLSLIHI